MSEKMKLRKVNTRATCEDWGWFIISIASCLIVAKLLIMIPMTLLISVVAIGGILATIGALIRNK